MADLHCCHATHVRPPLYGAELEPVRGNIASAVDAAGDDRASGPAVAAEALPPSASESAETHCGKGDLVPIADSAPLPDAAGKPLVTNPAATVPLSVPAPMPERSNLRSAVATVQPCSTAPRSTADSSGDRRTAVC
jgi:hypothetical protein